MRMKPYPDRDGKRVWLSKRELQMLIDDINNHETLEKEIGVKLAARAGLRRKELANVKVKDLVEDEKGHPRIRVWEGVAKKEHYREPPIPHELATQIDSLARVQGLDPNDEIVSVSDRTIFRVVRRACDRLEEETNDEGWSRVDVHDLRRSWATHVLADGVLPSVVMEWGGWKNWETFRKHYLGEFSPEVLEREREKVDFLAEGDAIETEPVSHTVVPDSSANYAGD
ncbi:tyrosine-type recombinase/integrase [Natronorubrum sp. JWXQ-INN-674]|uniref:Tyrosine-type recombinase/integrase n=2 Tax=Natronorubrum halalkaliphilum TaxID=2691917 RepID=A0A6B0VR20_9EURY|nr:tyrosine-type recombinase/integrase [Natronorubrum halalkaliphilum]